MSSIKVIAVLITAIILSIALSGCIGGDNIGDILENPRQYDDVTVHISGTVIDELSIPLVSIGAFEVDDGTGSIWVITEMGTPTEREQISVAGSVKTAFSIGGMDFGTIIYEDAS